MLHVVYKFYLKITAKLIINKFSVIVIIASYYRQLSADSKMKNYESQKSWYLFYDFYLFC